MRLILLGILLLPMAAAGQAKRSVPMTAWNDAEHGVSLQYPSVWSDKPEPSYLGTAFATETIQPKATFTFSPKGNLYEKTVLTGLTFSYFVLPGMSLEACVDHAQKSTAGDRTTKTVMMHGVPFTEVSGGQAGMCHEQSSKVDVTVHDGSCFAFERDVNTRCYGNGDGSRKLTVAEQRALDGHLQAVMDSVRFAPPAVPMTAYSDSANGVQLEYPAVWKRVSGPDDYCSSGVTLNGRDGMPKPAFSVNFDGAGNVYQGTTLGSLNFAFGIKQKSTAESCAAVANGLNEDGPHDRQVTIHGVTYSYGSGGSCGLGHGLDEKVYTTMRYGRCYIFEEDFFTANFEGARDLTQAEMDALQRHLDGVMQTVRLR